MSTHPTIGWFGKLPCAGDFVHRRLPYALIDTLDNWLRQGMSQLRATRAHDWQHVYHASPMWNCALPSAVAGSGCTLIGLIAPSRDRVGREFPLCAGIALAQGEAPGPLLATTHEWLATLGRVVIHAQSRPTTVDAFDNAVQEIQVAGQADSRDDGASDILAILNARADDVPTVPMPLAHALPWPELPQQFDAEGTTSYWWTNTSGGAPLRGFVTEAGLAPSLMLTLMRPQPDAGIARR